NVNAFGVFPFRFPIDEHRADARAQEMIRAAGTETAEFFGPDRAGKCQSVFMIGIVGDLPPVGRCDTAQSGKNSGGNGAAVSDGWLPNAAEYGALFLLMRRDEPAHLIDGFDAVQVALALRAAPCEQAMASQNQALRARVFP